MEPQSATGRIASGLTASHITGGSSHRGPQSFGAECYGYDFPVIVGHNSTRAITSSTLSTTTTVRACNLAVPVAGSPVSASFGGLTVGTARCCLVIPDEDVPPSVPSSPRRVPSCHMPSSDHHVELNLKI